MTRPKASIPAALRARVAAHARYRCGYCLRTEELTGMPMTIDHLVPEALGGTTDEANLWLACHRCNGYKGIQTHGDDPDTGTRVPLFNPRNEPWSDHFQWDATHTQIIGRTPTGRVTVHALHLNNPEIVVARRLWVSAGWWPPEE